MRDQHARLSLLFASQLHLSLLALLPALSSAHSKCILFNFGDSNSDPGALMAVLGLYLGPPSGQQFFHRPTGRFCNGRLYIDFICQSLNIDLLSAFLESSGSDFTHGVNFAVSGASTEVSLYNPFSLSTQAGQFGHFQNRTRELRRRGKGSMINEKEFRNAVYSIDIGQNDINLALVANSSYQEVVNKIPIILERIENSTKALYKIGARKFWIYNTGPLGCLPQTLALRKKNDSELDELGCLALYNNAAKAFNEGLSKLSDKIRSELVDAFVVHIDMYAIKYDLFANPVRYGFEKPLMACCGNGGPPYNYVNKKTCGEPTATACADPSRSVSWDGVHYTEAANAVIASKILSGEFSKPLVRLKSFCTHELF
ncbi:GDSL esterase/lipase LIP-4 isoform X2 [Beta vulgaris subsp. vulgaris]|uniref:GDSL esterase/lipase LIP-4 isoform X2 n=1 Tax=Beta vulgaris subsp. vulgaris TaxID=3555 RepID=UPI00203742D6|nr:GDSL esterase/lipase LIP-4 isoform X2 [Beta vulgaris subsp. vulgaris]XP_057248744.1 GDSL esterase/lipase LIP-4 isoform X2 [Beta vulgaris subsp. vulgaris]